MDSMLTAPYSSQTARGMHRIMHPILRDALAPSSHGKSEGGQRPRKESVPPARFGKEPIAAP